LEKQTIPETHFMKTIAQIIGGAQALPSVSFELQECFEGHLTGEYKTFLNILRVAEKYTAALTIPKGGMGPPPYPLISFFRSELAKRYFDREKTSNLMTRLQCDPNLRLVCGFEKVPDKSPFSRAFARIAEMKIMDKVQEEIARPAFPEGTFVQQVCRDSTAIPAREKVPLKKKEKTVKKAKKRGRPPKNALKEPKEPTVLARQVTQDADKAIAALDANCSWGVKKKQPGACRCLERV
jgi:hypothetical protein